MNAPKPFPTACAASEPFGTNAGRLHDLARQAITASSALTSACLADQTLSEAQYAKIDDAACEARRHLLNCLKQDHGIDPAMADQLAALL